MIFNNNNEKVDFLIIGSGPAGLGAGAFLKQNQKSFLILEAKPSPFGHCASFQIEGVDFDEGPHISFTSNEEVKKIFAKSCPDYLTLKPVTMVNHWNRNIIPHPVQSHLAYLPSDVAQKSFNGILNRPKLSEDVIDNYRKWLEAQFGTYFTDQFVEVYTKKYWTVAAKDLTTGWVGQRVIVPSIESIESGLKEKKVNNQDHYFKEFRYPPKGGFQSFLKDSFDSLKSHIVFNQPVIKIDLENKYVICNNQKKYHFKYLLSSIPLDQIPHLLSQSSFEDQQLAEKLVCTSIDLYSFVFKSDKANLGHWGYVYDNEIPFARYYYPKSLMGLFDDTTQAVQVEVYSSKFQKNKFSYEQVVSGLESIGVFKKNSILKSDHRFIKYGNVVFDHNHHLSEQLYEKYSRLSYYGIGRYGHWKYLWSDESYMDGFETAKSLI